MAEITCQDWLDINITDFPGAIKLDIESLAVSKRCGADGASV